MDAIISALVTRFERGGLTRRQLVRALAGLVAAGTAAPLTSVIVTRNVDAPLGGAT